MDNINVGEDGLRIIDNSNVYCDFNFLNESTEQMSIAVLLATYTSSGKLHSVQVYDVDIESGETETLEIDYQFDVENEFSGKLMIWNASTNLMPIRASIDFSQTSGINAWSCVMLPNIVK